MIKTLILLVRRKKKLKELEILNQNVKALSYNFRYNNRNVDIIAPVVTSVERECGNITIVFCGSANAEFTYYEGFSILNESRKK